MFGLLVPGRKPLSVHHSPAILASDSWFCCFSSCLCFLLGTRQSFARLVPMAWGVSPSSLCACEHFSDGWKMILPLSHAIAVSFSEKSGKISRRKGREEMEIASAFQEKKATAPSWWLFWHQSASQSQPQNSHQVQAAVFALPKMCLRGCWFSCCGPDGCDEGNVNHVHKEKKKSFGVCSKTLGMS